MWYSLKSINVLMLLMLLFLSAPFAVAEKTVTYSVPSGGEKRIDFNVKVLKLALEHSRHTYTVQASSRKDVDQSQAQALVEAGELDLMWSASDSLRESKLSLVPIPFDYGLLGYRVLIIPTKDRRIYESVHRLNDLQRYRPLQGKGWVDAHILTDAGFKVQLFEFNELANRLQVGKGDFIPRSIREVTDDFERWRKEADVSIDQRSLLIYKVGDFFYVNRKNRELYDDLVIGLARIYENGELKRLIADHFKERGIDLKNEITQRVSFRLDNPYQSETVKGIDDKYFNIYAE